MVRVLLLDPFRSRGTMIEVPVAVTGRGTGQLEFGGIDPQALDNVLRVPTARHSYRENVVARSGLEHDAPLGTVYRFVTWSFDHVLRLPGFTFTLDRDGLSGSIVGPAILFKLQVRLTLL